MFTDDSVSKFGYKPGNKIVPGYRLKELIGGGNFGEVWRATGPGGVPAAIKILDLTEMTGKVERKALDRIRDVNNPNLVPIFGIWSINRDGGLVDDPMSSSGGLSAAMAATAVFDAARVDVATRLVIAMKLGEMSLFKRLEQCQAKGEKGIPCNELLGYMHDAARGIDYLNERRHDLGNGPVSIVHCDIKPQNLLLVGGGVQVCDYSLVRPVEDVQKTAMGGSCTPAYAAPELHIGKPCVTSDQYCLAMSYVELRTGKLPYPEDTKATDLFYVKYERKLDLSCLKGEEVQRVIRKAADPDVNSRFSSCCEMVEALRQAEEMHTSTKPHWFPPRAKISSRTWRRVAVGFMVAAVAVAGLAWYVFQPKPAHEKIVQLIQAGRVADAFEMALTLRQLRSDNDGDFGYVVQKWSEAVTTRGQQYDFPGAIDVLRSTPAKIVDDDEAVKVIRDTRASLWEKQLLRDWLSFLDEKSPEGLLQQGALLDALQKDYGEKDPDAKDNFANWQTVLGKAIRDAYLRLAAKPELFTDEKLTTLMAASRIPKDDKDQVIDALRASLFERFGDSLTSPFVTADQILKNVEDIARRHPDVYQRLDFQIADEKGRRWRAEFQFDLDGGNYSAAGELIGDTNKNWPEKPKDAAGLAKEWLKNLSERLARGYDKELENDCNMFLHRLAKDPAVPELRLIRARVRFHNGSRVNQDEWKEIAAGVVGKKPLLLQLELIGIKPSAPEEEQRLLDENRRVPPDAHLTSWERGRYEEIISGMDGGPVAALDKELTPDFMKKKPGEIRSELNGLIARAQSDLEASNSKQKADWKAALDVREKIYGAVKASSREDALASAEGIAQNDAKEKWEALINRVLPDSPHEIIPVAAPEELLDAAVAALSHGGSDGLKMARQKLAEIAERIKGMPGASGDLWSHRVAFWQGMADVAAHQPSASPSESTRSSGELRTAMEKVLSEQKVPKTILAKHVPVICLKLEAIAGCNDKTILDESLELLTSILSSLGGSVKTAVATALTPLFRARINLVLQEAAPGDSKPEEVQKQFARLNQIWKEIKDGMPADALAECSAWNIEYRTALDYQDDDYSIADAISDFMGLPVKPGDHDSYVRYVRCLAGRENLKAAGKLSANEWRAFLQDLCDVIAVKDSRGLTRDRMKNARQWAVDAVHELCKAVKTGARGDVFRENFPKEYAERIHALLKQLKAGAKFDRNGDPVLAFAFGYSGLYVDPRDFDPAEDLLASEFKSGGSLAKGQASQAVPLLFAYVSRRLRPNPPITPDATGKIPVLVHAATFLRVFSRTRAGNLAEADANALSEAEAARIIDSILNPATRLADDLAGAAKGNRALELQRAELYDAAYDFSDLFSKVSWQNPDQVFAKPEKRAQRRAEILDSAIEAARQGPEQGATQRVPGREQGVERPALSSLLPAPRSLLLARLLLKRAGLLNNRSDHDLGKALEDAEEAVRYDASLDVAHHVVCAKVYLMKARGTVSDAEHLVLTDKSIRSCAAATAALSPGDAGAKADVLLVESAALVDRANYEADPEFEEQRKDLHKAIDDAKEAMRCLNTLPQSAASGRRPEEPDLALGNAYEDLAWIVDEDAPQNYGLAIKYFKDAREREGLGGRAAVSVGRCYYRIGVQGGFTAKEFAAIPRDLEIDSEEKARSMAETELLGANPFEPEYAVQAEYYLADLFNRKGDFAESDKHFGRLVGFGENEAAKSFYRYLHAACYLSRYEVFHRQQPPKPAAAAQALANAQALLAQIEACRARRVSDGFDSHRQTVWLKAQITLLHGDLEGARSELDNELGANPNYTSGHALLLLARGLLAQRLAVKAYNAGNVQAAIDRYREAMDYFNKELKCCKGREDLLAAHLNAAFSAVTAYRICFADRDPGNGPEGAEKYYTVAVSHLKEVDRLWKRRPKSQYFTYYYNAGLMFGDKIGAITSGRVSKDTLPGADAASATNWAQYIADLTADQKIKDKAMGLKTILAPYLPSHE
jgi:hypothetical protein